ncbi:MAG: ATP-binding protein, partial [Methanomicrobium sp.]|nr:ATP-binding protein [Methanomicrobium sp.]
HGTLFIIFNPVEQLIELGREKTENPEDDEAIDYIRTSLCGMNNSFKNQKYVNTYFYISDAGKREIIDKYNFFNKSDFQSVDHYFCGNFDENGCFNGKVKIFGEEFDHSFTPNRKPGITPYGPFELEIAFIEGERSNSSLSEEQWRRTTKKLEDFGGIYIYRDRFRVLPYGRPSEDWLEFEERRTRGAGYYFFSYRRMFGYIEITKDKNSNLCDKAGREGFIKNKAYRELKLDLIQFFKDLSLTYMRKIPEKDLISGKQKTPRQNALDNIKSKSLKDDKKQEREERKKYKEILDRSWDNLHKKETEIISLEKELEKISLSNCPESSELSKLESIYRETISEFSQLALISPARVILTEDLEDNYFEYNNKFNSLHKKLDDNYEQLLSLIEISSDNMEDGNYINKINEEITNLEKKISDSIINFNERLDLTQNKLKELLRDDLNQNSQEYKNMIHHFESGKNPVSTRYAYILKELLDIERNFDDTFIPKYESFVSHLERLDISIDEDLILGYYKEKYIKLEEKVDEINELAQLGIAVEIIDHQFKVLYAEMAASIKYFGKYANSNPDDKENYNQLKHSFEHLETNYQLLTPLYRTMRRGKKDITGKEIKDYLKKFYQKSFADEGIKFSTDSSFDSFVFKNVYDSVIIPVFINILNNAIYWLRPVVNRDILIKVENGMVLILNSGQRIKEGDLERIFERFFFRKPGGRGIGLYLAKTNLETLGYDIFATNDSELNQLKGACFVINKPGEINE